VRLYDDNESTEEGTKKYTMDKHKDSVNYLDFKLQDQLCASCGDDGLIFVFNFNSYRQEGVLKYTNPNHNDPAPIKIIKFLEDTDILVSADLDGYINFWCVSAPLGNRPAHPKKNALLCQIQDPSVADFGEQEKPPHFPIRAIDYDQEEKMLYTGDEMGFLIKWDISKVVDKLNDLRPSE